MEIINRPPRAGRERDHGTVAGGGRLLIKWFAYPECEFANAVRLVDPPSGCNAIPIGVAGSTALHAEGRQDGVIKPGGSLKIIGAQVHIGQHRGTAISL